MTGYDRKLKIKIISPISKITVQTLSESRDSHIPRKNNKNHHRKKHVTKNENYSSGGQYNIDLDFCFCNRFITI